jgi:hypothetical protein
MASNSAPTHCHTHIVSTSRSNGGTPRIGFATTSASLSMVEIQRNLAGRAPVPSDFATQNENAILDGKFRVPDRGSGNPTSLAGIEGSPRRHIGRRPRSCYAPPCRRFDPSNPLRCALCRLWAGRETSPRRARTNSARGIDGNPAAAPRSRWVLLPVLSSARSCRPARLPNAMAGAVGIEPTTSPV